MADARSSNTRVKVAAMAVVGAKASAAVVAPAAAIEVASIAAAMTGIVHAIVTADPGCPGSTIPAATSTARDSRYRFDG